MSYLMETVISQKHNVYSVFNPYQGMLELKKRKQVEAMVIDIDFDTAENLEFIEHIQTSGLYQESVIIVVSNGNEDHLAEAGLEVDEIIHKPFEPKNLVKKIEELMYQRTLKAI